MSSCFSSSSCSIICAISRSFRFRSSRHLSIWFIKASAKARFFLMCWAGARSEEVIDVYSAIEHQPPGSFKVNPSYRVDSVIARLEGVVVREYEKGGTAASIKAAVDRAIDQLHRETKEKGDRARDVVAGATDKLRVKIGPLQTEQEQKVEEAIDKEHERDG